MTLQFGESVDARLPWVRRIHDLDSARTVRRAGPKLRALRGAAEQLGDALRGGPEVVSVRTLPLSRLLYPTAFAFHGAAIAPAAPMTVMHHRALLVQVRAGGALRNVLFNPTDVEAGRAVGYYKELLDRTGAWVSRRIQDAQPTVDVQLRALGVDPADIDLIAFDHFHVQDLRGFPQRFPNALLLAPRCEWEDWDELHPLQRAWYVEEGKLGLPRERVVLTDADLALGEGCLLLRTPGHTSGNQTLFARAAGGVFGCSENGTSADSWSPGASTIAGLQLAARQRDAEVILNCNTPEFAAEQYTSMIVERSIVDRVPEAPAFVQMFPSSEVEPSWMAPGITPAMRFHERTSGVVQSRGARSGQGRMERGHAAE